MTAEHARATSSKLTHIPAGNAPNPFRRTMPNIHVSSATEQHTSSNAKEKDSTSARRTIMRQFD
jgi:hypothetical protein